MPDITPDAGGLRPTAVDRRQVLFGLIPAAGLLAVGSTWSSRTPAAQPPLALVYNGPQGCSECAPTVADALRKAPRPYRVEYVNDTTPVTASVLAEARLWVQPGGGADLNATWRHLKLSADAVREWIRNGGNYLGLCFGAYLAGHNPGFGILPGDTDSYVGTPGSTVPDDRDTVVEVAWRGTKRHMYFQDGPAFFLDADADATVLATYTNGLAAVVVAPYGKGRVGVSGPHPEADASWYEDEGLTNPDGVRFDLFYDLVDTTVRR